MSGSRGIRIPVLVSLLLCIATAALATHVASKLTTARIELGRVRRTRLDADVKARLSALTERVFVTYYVTARERMPSRLRSLESDVADVLGAMRAQNPTRFDFQIVDPAGEDAADLERFAARRKVAPTRVRSVTKDAVSEQEIWSTLTVARGTQPAAIANGIGAEHVQKLARLVLAELDALEQPPRPRFGFIAPNVGYAKLRATIAQKGDVVELANGDDPGLDRVDALVWMEPKAIDAATIARLRRFLDRGGSALVAGARLHGRVINDQHVEGGRALELEDTGFGIDALAQGFGLAAAKSLILDGRNQVVPADGIESAPFRVLAIAPNFDFKSMSADLGGQLLFELPSTFTPDSGLLAELGLRAHALVTTSDDTWTVDANARFVGLAELEPTHGVALAKQPIMVRVEPADAWRGFLVLAGSPTPFHDDFIDQENVAHPRLAQIMLDSLTTPERLLYARLELDAHEPVAEQSAFARAWWRAFCIGFVPLLVWIVRRKRRPSASTLASSATRGGRAGLVPRVLAACAAAAIVAFIAGRVLGAVDVSRAGMLRLHPTTLALARRAHGDGKIQATWFVSSDAALPPELKEPIGRLRGAIERLRKAGADLTLSVVHPDELDANARKALEADGVHARRATSMREEATTVRAVNATLRLEARGHREQLEFATPRAFESLEFRLAFALHRLELGHAVTLAVASDVPRLSGAEAHQFFQSRGLIPPKGVDVHAGARAVLAGLDFDVMHVNPQAPPTAAALARAAAILWLQPRRPAELMLAALAGYVYRGGNALVAAQHFVMQARQYRGADFDFVFWPQPQTPDIDQFWFPEFGVKLVREVLFDELHTHVAFESQVHTSARREFRAIDLAAPFLVRVLPDASERAPAVTRSLTDLPFLFSSFFALDATQLAAAGLDARTLLTTSTHAWSFDWKGGWLDRGLLPTGFDPPTDKDGAAIPYLVRAPLVVDLRGSFPWPKQAFAFAPIEMGADGVPKPAETQPYPEPEPTAEHRPGRIVLSACSELWKDQWLLGLADRFRSDHLLENLAVDLALGPEFTELVTKRQVAEGFAPPPEPVRNEFRIAALAFLPILALLVGAMRRLALRSRCT